MHPSLLLGLFATPLSVFAAPAVGLVERQTAAPCSIDTLIKAKGKKYFGVATDKNRLTAGSNAAIIQANFGCVTPENSMKWETTECMYSNSFRI
jgi:endo-1,4-beta-xylanase